MRPSVLLPQLLLLAVPAHAQNSSLAADAPEGAASMPASIANLAVQQAAGVKPTTYATTICEVATSFSTITPASGQLVCPECLVGDILTNQLLDALRHIVRIVPAFLGLTENGLPLNLITSLINGISEINDVLLNLATLPALTCLTIANAKTVVGNLVTVLLLLRDLVMVLNILSDVIAKIPTLSNQVRALVNQIQVSIALVVKNVDGAFHNSGGCFACGDVAVANSYLSQLNANFKTFSDKYDRTILPIPLFTACDNQLTAYYTTSCTSTVVTVGSSVAPGTYTTTEYVTVTGAGSATSAPAGSSSASAGSSSAPRSSSASLSGSVDATAVSESSKAAPAPSTSVADVTVVSSYTTCITSPGVVTLGTHTYTVTAPTTITVTDCPCTIPVPKTTAAAQVETTCDWTTVTTVVPSFTTYCPEPTTFCHADVCHTVTAPTTITVTNCPCTIATALPVVSGSIVAPSSGSAVAPSPAPSAASAPVASAVPAASAPVAAVPAASAPVAAVPAASASAASAVPAASAPVAAAPAASAPVVAAPAVSSPAIAIPAGSGVIVANAAPVAKPFIAGSLVGALMLLL